MAALPSYFYEVPASSSGKYHPRYALGDGGLVRHTKAAVYIAQNLLSLECFREKFPADERDCLIAAVLLHDGCKSGIEKQAYTVFDHPLQVVNLLKSLDCCGDIPSELFNTIAMAISSHMGQFNTDRSGKEVLPKPKTEQQIFVHMCDYLASRKPLIFEDPDGEYAPNDFRIDELAELHQRVIDLCKELIAIGVARDDVYTAIENVAGVKNPNSIQNTETLYNLLGVLGKMNTAPNMMPAAKGATK